MKKKIFHYNFFKVIKKYNYLQKNYKIYKIIQKDFKIIKSIQKKKQKSINKNQKLMRTKIIMKPKKI